MARCGLAAIDDEVDRIQDAGNLLLVLARADDVDVPLVFFLTEMQVRPWPSVVRFRCIPNMIPDVRRLYTSVTFWIRP